MSIIEFVKKNKGNNMYVVFSGKKSGSGIMEIQEEEHISYVPAEIHFITLCFTEALRRLRRFRSQ